MDRKGGVFAVLGIIFLLIGVAAAGTGIYLYDFYVFKTIRVCVSQNSTETYVGCSEDLECRTTLLNNVSEIKDGIESAPDFVQQKFSEILDAAVYCDGTCYVREIYGSSLFGGEDAEKCNDGDSEISMEIRGKEGIEILKFLKENSEAKEKFIN